MPNHWMLQGNPILWMPSASCWQSEPVTCVWRLWRIWSTERPWESQPPTERLSAWCTSRTVGTSLPSPESSLVRRGLRLFNWCGQNSEFFICFQSLCGAASLEWKELQKSLQEGDSVSSLACASKIEFCLVVTIQAIFCVYNVPLGLSSKSVISFKS